MEMKHTRGPWKVGVELSARSGEYLIHLDAGDKGRGIAIARTVPASGKELQNARVLAAAPDLLEALTNLLLWAEEAHRLGKDAKLNYAGMDDARVAIKKATGVWHGPV